MRHTHRAFRSWKIPAAVLPAFVSAVGAISWSAPPIEHRLPLGGSAPAEGESGFRSTRSDEEKQQVLASIRDALKSALSDPALFVDHEDLQAEMIVIIRAIVEGDGVPYYRHEVERGCTLDRTKLESVATQRRSWGMLDKGADAVAALPDEELFDVLWESAESHGFAVHAIDTSQIYFGRGLNQVVDGVAWPRGGIRGTFSKFVPSGGPLTQEEYDEIDRSDRSAFIRLRVQWASAGTGHVRINLYHDGQAWRPLVIEIGCAGTGWPFPIL